MRVLVCGGRDYGSAETLWNALDNLKREANHDCMLVIQGGARGADRLAREWCKSRGVPFHNYPADWTTHGKGAGPIRNQYMIDHGKPDRVIAFPGGKGTADMIRRAQAANLPVILVV